MKIIGKETIHPFLFYSGKTAGYIIWVLYVTAFFELTNIKMISFKWLDCVSYFTFLLGLFFIILSLINLGKSTSLGLPDEKTVFIKKGLYRFSRNPMYVGFNLFTISSVLINANPFLLIFALYSIVVYHFIIKGEENFLEKRFAGDYINYKNKVRRYL
ncbi:MAG: isoprenylcysteine carboxylmethyltransferase family protein [Spirochaetes bacterium]|nr:isoprenylcysteine carboxylmethyltransferase family protein [Spirochaetota bacterium]